MEIGCKSERCSVPLCGPIRPLCVMDAPSSACCKKDAKACPTKVRYLPAKYWWIIPNECPIFGEHDAPYLIPPRKRVRNELVNRPLGYPMGYLNSNVPIKDGTAVKYQSVRFATYLKTLALIYLKSVREWDRADIDRLMKEGQELYQQSIERDKDEDEVQRVDVYSPAELKINRVFSLNNHTFQIELEPQFALTLPKSEQHSTVNKIKKMLELFFSERNYCLLTIFHWYIFIWKWKGIFFVLDFNGRDIGSFTTDTKAGLPMLICLRTPANVENLIRHRSDLNENDPIALREMLVVRLTTPDGLTRTRKYEPRISEFQVITDDYGFLLTNLHLTLNPAEPLRNRSALPVGIAAMLTSKIDHPATWDVKMLDHVICYGVNMCRHCWEPCIKFDVPINLNTFPRQIRIGQFVAEFLLVPNLYHGYWKCVPMLRDNSFQAVLKTALSENDNILFQINNQMYAIWKKTNFIYLMDPYRHRVHGTSFEEDPDEKSATVRMFSNEKTMIQVFHQILLESNRNSVFHIHAVKIVNLIECPSGAPIFTPLADDTAAEVQSINEDICFVENYEKCLEELAVISDYEEDVVSIVESLKSLEEEAAKPEAVEEEEGGAEEHDGLEIYSSGSKTSSKRKGKGGKGKGGMGKGGKGKGGKGKGGKGGKGKGGKDKDGTGKGGKGKKAAKPSGKGTKHVPKPKGTKDKKDKKDKKPKKDKGSKEPKVKKEPKEKKPKKNKKDKNVDDSEVEDKPKKEKIKKDKKKSGKGESDSESDGASQKPAKKPKQKGDKDEDSEKPSKKPKDKGDKDEESNKKRKKSDSKADEALKKPPKKPSTKGDDDPNKPRKKSTKKGDSVGSEGTKEPPRKPSQKGDIDDKFQKPKDSLKSTGSSKDKGRDPSTGLGDDKENIGDNADVGEGDSFDGGDDDDAGIGDDGGDGLKAKPNHYPGYMRDPRDLAVTGSENGSYESICKLLRAGFKCADRVLVMTPWGNYVVFRGLNVLKKIYFIYDGCTCNVDRFRHLDLSCGTAGLLSFKCLHDIISYIVDSRSIRQCIKHRRKVLADDICKAYCTPENDNARKSTC